MVYLRVLIDETASVVNLVVDDHIEILLRVMALDLSVRQFFGHGCDVLWLFGSMGTGVAGLLDRKRVSCVL